MTSHSEADCHQDNQQQVKVAVSHRSPDSHGNREEDAVRGARVGK